MASKNIPADMVNKLQVIDRKSDLARLTGVDDGEDETVINLTVKKGMNNGWLLLPKRMKREAPPSVKFWLLVLFPPPMKVNWLPSAK